MDPATNQTQLENELRSVEAFQKHPLMQELLADNRAQQEALISLLCNESVVNIETFFAHFAALGHLRGLRRMPGLVEDKLEEIKTRMKENT